VAVGYDGAPPLECENLPAPGKFFREPLDFREFRLQGTRPTIDQLEVGRQLVEVDQRQKIGDVGLAVQLFNLLLALTKGSDLA
jgi:hypothetical protein